VIIGKGRSRVLGRIILKKRIIHKKASWIIIGDYL